MLQVIQMPQSNDQKKVRTTLFIDPDLIFKLDRIASMDHINKGIKSSRTDKINEALEEYVAKWEKKNGPIK